MNHIATIPKLPNGLTPLLSKHLGSTALAEHRATIFVELEVLAKKFDRFGWDRDRGTASHDRICMDWMNALQDYPITEVQAACASAVLENPNKMPNEGHVKAQILKARQAMLQKQPKPVDPRVPFKPKNASQKAEANALVSQFARRSGVAM